jgi:hypothetical protein
MPFPLTEKGKIKMSKHPSEWTDDEIRQYYDSHLNCTLLDLSCETGYSVPELKKIILADCDLTPDQAKQMGVA